MAWAVPFSDEFDPERAARFYSEQRRCHKNKNETKNENQGQQQDIESWEVDEMEGLLADYERGALQPRPVKLPANDLPPAVRRVADNLELLFGLRAAVMDDRPMAYACRWRTKQLGLNYRTVHRCLAALTECGAIVKCESASLTSMYRPGSD